MPNYKIPEDEEIIRMYNLLNQTYKELIRISTTSILSDTCKLNGESLRKRISDFIWYYLTCYAHYTIALENSSSVSPKIQAQIAELKNKNEELTKSFNYYYKEYQKLTRQVSNTFSGEETRLLKEQLDRMNTALQEEKTQRTSAQYAYEDLKLKYQKATEVLDELKDIKSRFDQQAEELKKVREDKSLYLKRYTETDEKYKQLKEELEEYKASKQGKKFAVAINAKKERKALETERDKLQQDYDTIKEQYEKAFRDSQDSAGSITALEERINNLKQQLNEEKAKSKKLEQDLLLKEEELEQKETLLSNARYAKGDAVSQGLEKELKEKNKEIRELKSKLEQFEKTPNLQKRLHPEEFPQQPDNSKELEELRIQLAQKDAEISQLQSREIPDNSEELEDLRIQLAQKDAEISQLQNREIPDNSEELEDLRNQLAQKNTEIAQLQSREIPDYSEELEKLRIQLAQKNTEIAQLQSREIPDYSAELEELRQLKEKNKSLENQLQQEKFSAQELEKSKQSLEKELHSMQEETKLEEEKQATISEFSPDMRIAVSAEELDNQHEAEFFNVRKSMTGELDFQESDERRAAIVIIRGKAYPNAYYYRNLLTGQGTANMEMLKNLFDFEHMNNTSVCILSDFVPAIVTQSEEIRLVERGKLIMK